MNKPKSKQRPVLITILCCLGFLGIASSPLTLIQPMVKAIGTWYQGYLVVHFTTGLIALIGVWKMKRWGVLLYVIAATVGQIVLAIIGYWSIFAAVLYGTIISVMIYYLPQMD